MAPDTTDLTASTLTVGSALRAAIDQHAERPALRYAGDTVTYRQLGERVDVVAANLRRLVGRDIGYRYSDAGTDADRDELAVRPGRGDTAGGESGAGIPVVALMLDRSPGFVTTVLAAVSAGMAYLPLDPAMPDDYVHAVLTQANPRLIVTDPLRTRRLHHPGALIATGADLTRAVRAGRAAGSAECTTRPGGGDASLPRPTTPGDAAYVIYTSGSTGTPKGVVVPHRALLNSTAARTSTFGVPSRLPLLHSVAFDLSTGVIFWALLSGGTLVINPAPLHDVAATLRLIHDEAVTHLEFAASLYPALLQRAQAAAPTHLRSVMIGGERWSSAVIERHAALLPGTSLYNEYGPTEACVWTSAGLVYDAATGTTAPMNIGRPALNTGYLICDERGAPVGGHGEGELYITGDNLASGYLHDPQLTAQKFVQLDTGQRAYRTGDLVARTERDDYVFLGRVDRQIKVRGNRVEAGHVETVLMRHPRVEQAHVMAGDDHGLAGALLAYLVPRGDDPIDLDAIGAELAAQLPDYMVPSAYVSLPQLPRTLSGKIDPRRLPNPVPQMSTPREPPDGPVETALAEAAADILGLDFRDVDSCGMTTPLTWVGANSLTFVRLSAAISRHFGVEVPISALFQAPTLRAIADQVEAASPQQRPPLVAVPPAGPAAPLSAQQQQIWILHQLAPDAVAYNTQFSLLLRGPLDVSALNQALTRIVARHEILRSTFHGGSDGPHQIVHNPWPVTVDVHDLTALTAQARHDALREAIAVAVRRPFDVTRLPLVRWHLYRLEREVWRLLQVEHHFAHDGWSASLFLAEIRDGYWAALTGQAPQLPALPVQYRDYALWHQRWRDSADFAQQRDYWAAVLAGCPTEPVTFTPDRPRPARQSFTGDCLRLDIPPGTVDRVDELARRHQVSRFAVFLSAFALLTWRHTGHRQLVIGTALANRRDPATAAMLGMFVNALPLRLTIDADATASALLQDTMRTLLGAQDHQEFPLVEIISRLGLLRDPARNPLFCLMFAFHDSPRPTFDTDGLHGDLIIEHNGTAKNDINVVCVPNPPPPGSGRSHDGVNVLFEYNTDLYERDTTQHLLSGFVRVLDTLASVGPGHRTTDSPALLRDLDLLGSAQTAAILAAGRGPRVRPPFPTLHGGVEVAIARWPDEVAVQQGARAVSYRGLDRIACAIERRMVELGVQPGAIVAVACDASPELLAGWLAAARQGCAYLTVDLSQPIARRTLLLADANPVVIICAHDQAAALHDSGYPLIHADRICDGQARSTDPRTPPPVGQPPRPRVKPTDPAYLIYTSGSTGTPKAVVATHANAVTALHARTVHHRDSDTHRRPRTLVTLPVIFDVAASMMFWTWWQGGTIVLPDTARDARDPDAIRALVERHRVTHVNFVASFYDHVVDALSAARPTSLRVVAIGGEPCTPDLVLRHAAGLPSVALDNEYGPTETTVWCSTARLHTPRMPPAARLPAGSAGLVTIGTPVANYQLVVLDAQRCIAPVGALGELYIGGPGVTDGYLHRPDLTAERFITLDGGLLDGQRLYRSGDRARLRPDGRFEVLGRLDDQIKIRGHRVAPEEIRRCLITHPAVADAHVTVYEPTDGPNGVDGTDGARRQDGERDTARLVAYIATQTATETTQSTDRSTVQNRGQKAEPRTDEALTTALGDWTACHLPTYMRPAAYVICTALPRTPTGKIDRARLPRISGVTVTNLGVDRRQDAQPEPPTTQRQEQLFGLWRRELGQPRIGIDDDFFTVGGDSLQAIRIAARAAGEGLALSVAQILLGRTVRAVAELLTPSPDRDREPRNGDLDAVEHRPPGTAIALTSIQGWFFAQEFADADHFNQARLFDIAEPVDAATLRAAVTWTLRRHDAFRTRFHRDSDGWHARLGEPNALIHERTLPASSPGAALDLLRAEVDFAHRCLSIGDGALARLTLFIDAHRPRRRWLHLVMHHLIVDVVSWDLLVADLVRAYRVLAAGQALTDQPAPGLPSVRLPVRRTETRTAVERDGEACGIVGTADVTYWRDLNDTDLPLPRIATQRSAPPAPYGELRHLHAELTARASRFLLHHAPRLGAVSTFSVVLAALRTALDPISDRPGLYVLLEGHGRGELAGSDGVVGWLSTLYPAVLSGGRGEHLVQAAIAVERDLRALPPDTAAFGRARYLHPDSDAGRLLAGLPLPQITVNYLGHHPPTPADAPLRPATVGAGQSIGSSNVLPTGLHLTVAAVAGRVQLRLAYDEQQYGRHTTRSVWHRLVCAIEHAGHAIPLTAAPIAGAGDALPQFLLPGVGGSIETYLPLARALGLHTPCYVLQPGDPTDGAGLTIPQIAADHLRRVRELHPHGGLRITGWSFGAAVAYELAHQLRTAGEHVESVTLLDPPPLTGSHADPHALTEHLRPLLPDLPLERIEAAVTDTVGLAVQDRADQLIRRLDADGLADHLTHVVRDHDALARWAPPGPLDPVQIVLSATTAASGQHDLRPWLDCSRRPAVVRVVPGTHRSMLLDSLDDLLPILAPTAEPTTVQAAAARRS